MKIPRLSPETLLVLEGFLQRPAEWRYGYELSRQTGLKSGTLYPILMRLEKCALLEAVGGHGRRRSAAAHVPPDLGRTGSGQNQAGRSAPAHTGAATRFL